MSRRALFALFVVAALGVQPLIPPSSVEAAAEPTRFSAERALEHVAAMAREPHPLGSTANARVRDYLVAELVALGLEPELQTILVADYYGRSGGEVGLVNVLARVPGSDSSGAVALMGHYDSDPSTLGANDNAAAVGAILETARAVLAGPAIRNDLLLMLTDGEEPAPRYGASALVEEHRWVADIRLVANFEAIGSSGPSLLIESGPAAWVVDEFSAVAPRPAAFSFLPATVELLGGADTDFGPFRAAGVPGLNFAYLRGSPIYHTMADDVDSVDLASLQHHGSHALATARHFGEADLSARPESAGSVYFTVLRSLVVGYPLNWAGPLALVLIGLAGGVAYRRRAGGGLLVGSFVRGTGAVLAMLLACSVAAAVIWAGAIAVRDSPGIYESYFYLLVLLALTAWMFEEGMARFNRHPGRVDVAGGVLIVWTLLATVTALWLPAASYLFLWPAAAGWAAWAWPVRRRVSFGRLVAAAAPAGILMLPAIDVFYQFAQPRPGNPDSVLPGIVSVPVFLALLVVALVWCVVDRSPGPAPVAGSSLGPEML